MGAKNDTPDNGGLRGGIEQCQVTTIHKISTFMDAPPHPAFEPVSVGPVGVYIFEGEKIDSDLA